MAVRGADSKYSCTYAFNSEVTYHTVHDNHVIPLG